ncbi:protein kinase domain-containing protein [Zavarzinella formosa]|uniref:serine/threonine-protein kinase n=1 Tax=Zavarzinella formosa TaxID=360055 RepID=UPI0002E1E991|nr:serine/threonine-protein kinase [Zavarzinella formosa]
MPDEPRLLELLDELFDSKATPEEVCRSCPELLPQVRSRWLHVRQAQAELDALFPPYAESEAKEAVPHDGAPLPQIAGYEVIGILGHGGMGVVFRARHLGLNRVVAMKMAIAGAYASKVERERFQREAEAVAGLRHPNIVQIHDVGDSDGRPYFTMELVDGGNLAQKLTGTPRSPREAAQLLVTLAGAVHAAHQGGIVHRDLKPSNVFFTADEVPKIGDFGLARRRDDEIGLTRTGTALGTPSYMAPEQAAGKRLAVEPAVDIYALGAILYELLTGCPPFRAETATETIQQALTLDPVPPSRLNAKVPRDLEIICLKCLGKEPGLRYAGASDLADDLDRFLHGEAIAARPEGRLRRLARRIRRRPVPSASLALAVLLAVILIGGGIWLLFERAASTRRIEAEQAAAERTADEHLREMAESMKTASWPEARAALERAKAWLGSLGSDELKRRVEQGARDLELVARLDAIRLTGYTRVGTNLDFTKADEEYEAAFREAGLGQVGDPVDAVAARVKASNIRNALLAALDNWAGCATDSSRRDWVADVTNQIDGNTTPWRVLARDPASWKDEAAVLKLIADVPRAEQSVALLLAAEAGVTAEKKLRQLFLKRIHEAHPRDFWVNLRLAMRLAQDGKEAEAIGYYQVAATIRPEVAMLQHNLGMALVNTNRFDEALPRMRQAIALDPTVAISHYNLANALSAIGRHTEAIEEAGTALRLGYDIALLHTILGKGLEALKCPSEALEQYRQAVMMDPKNQVARKELRGILLRLGRAEELQAVWAKVFEGDPPKHDDWYGYAELCLFVGREEDYALARHALLAKFGGSSEPYVAERVSRACLLRPVSGDDLVRAVALANRAAAADQSRYSLVHHAFQFVRGLAEYRQGRYDQAITTMQGEASRALGPAPRLVLAMARHRSGQAEEARKTLAAAIASHDWRASQIRDQDGWICHSLRREAEELIIPEWPALVAGTRPPKDNDERLALLGVRQFANRFRDCARLYADVFAADPNILRDLGAGQLQNAARFAALAGGGHGENGAEIGAKKREQLRSAARQWLRAYLDISRAFLDQDQARNSEWVRWHLNRCRETPDLAGLRDPAELEKLSPEERKDCLALWEETAALFNRANAAK